MNPRSVSIQCGTTRLVNCSMLDYTKDKTKLWSTMVHPTEQHFSVKPPKTPREQECSQCPISNQKEAGDENPPAMNKRPFWQLMGPDSTQLPFAISCDNETEAWMRIYPGNENEDNLTEHNTIFSLLNMLTGKTKADDVSGNVLKIDKSEKTFEETRNQIEEQDTEQNITQQNNGHHLKIVDTNKHNSNGDLQMDNAVITNEIDLADKTHANKETNTDDLPKTTCQMKDSAQEVNICNVPPRRKPYLSASGTVSVASVQSRACVSAKSSPMSRSEDVKRYPDPAISRTGLFSAAPTVRPIKASLNQPKHNFLIKQKSISEY